MKLAAVPTVPYFAYLDHQVDQVLYVENMIVGDRVLLIYGFNEEPKFIYHFHVLCIDPKVATSH